MYVLGVNFQIAENSAVEFPEHFVVIAGDENNLGAAFGLAQYGSQHIVVCLRPKHGFLHAPDIDDVAHQEQSIHFDVVQKIQQQVGAAAFEAKMDI
jgi:hypothetical protein